MNTCRYHSLQRSSRYSLPQKVTSDSGFCHPTSGAQIENFGPNVCCNLRFGSSPPDSVPLSRSFSIAAFSDSEMFRMLFIYYSFWRSVRTHFKTQWEDSIWNYLAVFSWYSFLWKQQNSKTHHTECLWVITSKNPKTPGIIKRNSTKEHWQRWLIWTKLCQVFLLRFFKWRNKLGKEAEGKRNT